jgi:hypothetical protein
MYTVIPSELMRQPELNHPLADQIQRLQLILADAIDGHQLRLEDCRTLVPCCRAQVLDLLKTAFAGMGPAPREP